MNMQQNTKHAARKTQIDRQVEKKTYTHGIDSWKQANNRERLCARETEANIGKAPRLGIHTRVMQTPLRVSESVRLWDLGNRIEQKWFLVSLDFGLLRR